MDRLPYELSVNIFQYLSVRELLTLRLVNKRFNIVALDSELWKLQLAKLKVDVNIDNYYQNYIHHYKQNIIQSVERDFFHNCLQCLYDSSLDAEHIIILDIMLCFRYVSHTPSAFTSLSDQIVYKLREDSVNDLYQNRSVYDEISKCIRNMKVLVSKDIVYLIDRFWQYRVRKVRIHRGYKPM